MIVIAANHVEIFGACLMILILAREFMVSGLREFMGPYNIQFPVSKLAKWKTAIQMLATGLLIIAPVSLVFTVASLIALLIATVLTWITGVDYLKTGLAHMKDMD
jgi:phosphatidylglycerophosphate synthase